MSLPQPVAELTERTSRNSTRPWLLRHRQPCYRNDGGNTVGNSPKWTQMDGNRRGGPATLRAAGPPIRGSRCRSFCVPRERVHTGGN